MLNQADDCVKGIFTNFFGYVTLEYQTWISMYYIWFSPLQGKKLSHFYNQIYIYYVHLYRQQYINNEKAALNSTEILVHHSSITYRKIHVFSLQPAEIYQENVFLQNPFGKWYDEESFQFWIISVDDKIVHIFLLS